MWVFYWLLIAVLDRTIEWGPDQRRRRRGGGVRWRLLCWWETELESDQAPDSETLLMPVFFSSTCFRQSGAAQHQLGFPNIRLGFVWKFRKPNRTMLLRTVCLSMRSDTPLCQCKRRYVCCVLLGLMVALSAVAGKKRLSQLPCWFIPWSDLGTDMRVFLRKAFMTGIHNNL